MQPPPHLTARDQRLTRSLPRPPHNCGSQGAHALPGRLLNFNTVEGFRRADLKGQLAQVGPGQGRGAGGRSPAAPWAFTAGPQPGAVHPALPALRGPR
jgi:hypothetical protein